MGNCLSPGCSELFGKSRDYNDYSALCRAIDIFYSIHSLYKRATKARKNCADAHTYLNFAVPLQKHAYSNI